MKFTGKLELILLRWQNYEKIRATKRASERSDLSFLTKFVKVGHMKEWDDMAGMGRNGMTWQAI